MATSGTVGQTQFSLSKIIDQAIRRCKQNPAVVLNAELVNVARSAMYLILTSLANRGLNLWRVEHGFLGLRVGASEYDLPAGTISIPNLNFVSATAAPGTLSAVVDGYQFELDSATFVGRVGFKPTASFAGAVVLSTSTDGVTYTAQKTLPSATYTAGLWYWFDLPVYESVAGVQVTSSIAITLSEIAVPASMFSIPMTQWNRDDYANQGDRLSRSRPSTNYFFDRQRSAKLAIWPIPTSQYDHIEYWLHRQIEDVALLSQEVDVPVHWMNAAVWLMAREFCAVLPGIDPQAVQLVMMESDRVLIDAEAGESDGASIRIQPRVAGYTR